MTSPAGDALAAIDLVANAGLSLVLSGGSGPVSGILLERLTARCSVLRLAASADVGTLEGGLDPLATVAAGRPVHRPSFADRIAGRVVVVAGAERIAPMLAALLADWIDEGVFTGGLVLLDEGDDLSVPALLADRIAMRVDAAAFGWRDLEGSHNLAVRADLLPSERNDADAADDAAVMVAIADRLGVTSLRAPLLALNTSRAAGGDRALAARLVLAPRATMQPPPPSAPSPTEEQEEVDGPDGAGETGTEADRLIEAIRVALPTGLIEGSSGGARMGGSAGTTPARAGSAARGRLGRVRRGIPAREGRLDLVATLLAAAPHQRSRGRGNDAPPLVRRDDLRVRRRQPRRRHATVIAVDASGSAAMARLGEVKGAIEQLLATSYVRRDEVALIAFRGSGAATLLPPTRSLARARRELAALPGGGGTPLAAGILTGMEQAVRSQREGRSVQLVLLTDGGANIARDGTADRAAAARDATAAAQQIAALGIKTLVIDASPRGAASLRALATAMNARYLALPRADDNALAAAIGGNR